MPEQPKTPKTNSMLEAAYCAVWNARYAAKDRFECMDYCQQAISFAERVDLTAHRLIREKIGEAQEYWSFHS